MIDLGLKLGRRWDVTESLSAGKQYDHRCTLEKFI